MKLPRDVNQAQFDAAVQAMRKVVGDEWIYTSDEDIHLYRDAYSPFYGEDEEYLPSGAVAPSSAEQVQEVVRIANTYKIPVWPVSTGRNLGYGGAAPRMSGTMVLDLKRMNRVLEVNEELAYAIVEPGVSYFELYRYLREHKIKLWVDTADPGWGSVIGNALDHGGGNTPHRDHFDSHCGMEVVLANGELMRTGMGALPNSPSWPTFKYGFGPHISPIFGQANFGIVTKMGIWLMPEPEAVQSHTVAVPREGDIVPLLRMLAHFTSTGIVDSTWTIGNPVMNPADPQVRELLTRDAPPAEFEKLAQTKGVGYWGLRLRFYGPQNIIEAHWQYVRKRISEIPGATFTDETLYRFPAEPDSIPDSSDDIFLRAALGIPNLGIFSFGAGQSQGHVFFSPIIPMTGEQYQKAQRVFKQAFKDIGRPAPAIAAGHWFKRNLTLLFGLPISHDPKANQKLRADIKHLVKVAAENGWGEYRTPTAFMDDVMDAFSFNNHALRRFHESIKDAVDPNGILAPGKSGIWPRRFRGKQA